jgi:hypothetical protein
MPVSEKEIVSILYKRIINEKLETEEQQQLDSWMASSPYNEKVCEEVENSLLLAKEIRHLLGGDEGMLWKNIKRKLDGQ